MRRNVAVAVLLGSVALLGAVLYGNIGKSRTFSIAPPPAPVKPAVEAEAEAMAAQLKQGISTTVVSSLTTLGVEGELTRPRYTGEDALRRHWEVTGAHATQQGSTVSGTYTLTSLAARWEDPSQTEPLYLTAAKGTFTPSDSLLVLTGEVSSTGLNVTLRAERVVVNMPSRTLVAGGAGGVVAEGAVAKGYGRITAPSLQVDALARTLSFTGGVHTVLTPQP